MKFLFYLLLVLRHSIIWFNNIKRGFTVIFDHNVETETTVRLPFSSLLRGQMAG